MERKKEKKYEKKEREKGKKREYKVKRGKKLISMSNVNNLKIRNEIKF